MALSPFLWFYADRCAAGSSRKPVGGQGGHPLHTYLLSVDCMDEPEDTLHCNTGHPGPGRAASRPCLRLDSEDSHYRDPDFTTKERSDYPSSIFH